MMAVKILKEYILGDMTARYLIEEETGIVELMFLPVGMATVAWEEKKQNIDSMIQIKLAGDVYTGSYAGGSTMHQNGGNSSFVYDSQNVVEKEDVLTIETIFNDKRGYEAVHSLVWKRGTETVESSVNFSNQSSQDVALESFMSFSLGGITPYLSGDGYEQLYLHRIRGVWRDRKSVV